jgi:regulator of protease activity HflC (stomatin/prohibitin superfamily)
MAQDDADAKTEDAKAAPPRKSWFRRTINAIEGWFGRRIFTFSILLILFVVALLYALPFMVYQVGPGHVGVRWYRLFGGTDLETVLGEGLHVIPPWDRIYDYDARLQRHERKFKALSVDGLPISIDLAWRYAIRRENVGLLHKYLGPNYEDVLIIPTLSEHVREVMAKYRPEDIWSRDRAAVTNEILQRTRKMLKEESLNNVGLDVIQLNDVLLVGIDLPVEFEKAVVDKQIANQIQLAWDYRLLREQKEAQRKEIEALGIRKFQDVVSYGLTDSYLRWRGIEATLELAQSTNAKVVVIGSPGAGGLPLILGSLDGLRDPPPTNVHQVGPTAAAAAAAAAKPNPLAGDPVARPAFPGPASSAGAAAGGAATPGPKPSDSAATGSAATGSAATSSAATGSAATGSAATGSAGQPSAAGTMPLRTGTPPASAQDAPPPPNGSPAPEPENAANKGDAPPEPLATSPKQ